STLNKSLDEIYNYHRKLYKRNYRLLAKYKQDNDSRPIFLKEDIPNNGMNERKDIYNNMKGDMGKERQQTGSLQKYIGNHKGFMKIKSCLFETKKYSHLEKKIFKELDYKNFLNNNRLISDKLYSKVLESLHYWLKECPLNWLFRQTVVYGGKGYAIASD
ncbi:hypothetical protein PMALA_043650, partial [Plasmodium malariae]